MNVLTKPRMTVDEFLAWAEGRPGRYELFRGEVYAMSPETVGHIDKKGAIYVALLTGIRARGLPCHALTDGATIRIDDTTAYEPDALVYCGPRLPPTVLEVPNPIIIVEALSPSTPGRCLAEARRIFPAAKCGALPDRRPYAADDPPSFARFGRRHHYACCYRRFHRARSARARACPVGHLRRVMRNSSGRQTAGCSRWLPPACVPRLAIRFPNLVTLSKAFR